MNNQFKNGYALLVGVDENEVRSLALPCTGTDVKKLAEVLRHKERCAYKAENVKLVLGKDATRDGIGKGLAWLGEKIKKDRSGNATAVVYYSGHGARVPDENGEKYYLIPYDMDLNEDKWNSQVVQLDFGRALPAEEFAGAIAKINPARLLVILDCCQAAGMNVKGMEGFRANDPLNAGSRNFLYTAIPVSLFWSKEKSAEAFRGADLGKLTQGRGRAVLSSSLGDQQSYLKTFPVGGEGNIEMSVFTYHLIEALIGHAQPQTGALEVLVSDVMSYVHRRVPETVRATYRKEQTPDFQINGNFPIALLQGGKGLGTGQQAPDPLADLAQNIQSRNSNSRKISQNSQSGKNIYIEKIKGDVNIG